MSSAESSLCMAPSNHSRQCARNVAPRLTVTAGGDIRMPAIVADYLLLMEFFGGIQREQ